MLEVQVFRKYDARPFPVPGPRADCTVRALSTATGMGYQNAWDKLYRLQGEHNHCFFELCEYLRKFPNTMGVVRYLSFPAQRGMPRVKLTDFQKRYPIGRYIVQVAGHATAVIDGVCLDTWYPRRKCVYGAWEMQRIDITEQS